MTWLGISGVVLFVTGLLAPVFGLILHRDFGNASFALCAAGMAAYGAVVIFRRRSGDRDTSGGLTVVYQTAPQMSVTIGMTEDTAAMVAMVVIERRASAVVWSSNNRWRGP